MSISFFQFKKHPKYKKILYWSKLISITGATQIFIQIIGFISGILIIRLLPVQEYAYYTIANTMLGTMTIITDGGVSNGLMVQGSKVWLEKKKLGVVLASALNLRLKFSFISFIVSIPFLFYLLLHNGASLITAAIISFALIPAFYASLSDTLFEIIAKLHQTIIPLQKNQFSVSIGRLILITLSIVLFPFSYIAILAGGVTRIWGNHQLKKTVYKLAEKNQQSNQIIQKEILILVKRVMPLNIYYCLSGQITIFLISIFGNTNSISQLGALGRISTILSLFSFILSNLVIPRFAKLITKRDILLPRFLQIMGLLLLIMCLITFGVYVFPNPILYLLGESYKGLTFELLLTVIGTCIALLSGTAYSLYSARGWFLSPIISISINIITLIIFINILDLSSLNGVLFLNIAIGSITLIQTFLFPLYKIFKI